MNWLAAFARRTWPSCETRAANRDLGTCPSAARAVSRAACVLATFGLLTGCGYSAGTADGGGASKGYQWKSLYRPGIKTVAVSVFTSRQFSRYDEIRFTQAVAKQLEAYTPYKIASRDVADTVLEGQIRSIRRTTQSNSPRGGVPQEQLFEMTVDFTWKDLRNGKILASRTVFDQTTAFYPTLGEGSFVGSQTATEKLALAVVQQLEGDW